ncbi:hypothetical protein M9Y10_004426 [Tritrichomonas musculus]|uniref:Uncharacterized protein n=1 Tax=Tritrichomonas musculus TaxID=1915356 RepID=A0ABR2JS03_9EUKA
MPNLHHEIAKKKRTRPIARLMDFIKPNYIGLKWRFFEFSIILKSASINYSFLYVLFYVLEFIASVFPALYVISGYNSELQPKYPPGKTMLPYWNFFNKFIPEFIYVETWLYIQSVLFFFILVLFFICFMAPRQCYFLHIFLNIQIHLILFPLTCGAFSYDIYYFLYLPADGAGLIPTILHFVLFCFYFCLIVILFFAESNSIISPHYGVAQWFSLFPLHYPFLLFFVTFSGFQMMNLIFISRHILLLLTIIFLAISAIITFIDMPFVLFVANEIYVAKSLTCIIIFIFDNLMASNILQGRRKLIFSMLPLLFAVIFFITHLLFKVKRVALTKMFTNLSENDSFEPLDINIKSASKMCIIVKLCIVSGQKIVISPKFVQYCLERFPDNEWFISYVAFLYVVVWNASEDVYKFLLHLLSLDVFNIATQYTLYQFVYCFMQTAQITSPAIHRKLQKYRHLVLKFVVAHKNFWMAAIEQNYDAFNVANDQMGVLMSKVEFFIKQLKLLYPLCPVIHCERSLFEADFHHNYSKSDYYYQKAAALLDHSNVFINSTFFYHYSLFFPGVQRTSNDTRSQNSGNNNKEDNSSEYCYLSFFENNDNALRSSVSLSIHDQYITSLTHTFHQRKEIPKIDPKFDTTSRRLYLMILLLLPVIIFGIFIYQVMINRFLNRCLDEYNEMNTFLIDTKKFRKNLNIAEFDLLLAINVSLNEMFFNFTINHLDLIRIDLQNYKYMYDTSENKIRDAISYIENSIEHNVSLSILFSKLNTYMMSARSLQPSNESSVVVMNETELIESFNMTYQFIDRIYFEFIDFFCDIEKNEMKNLKIQTFVIIAIEIFPFTIGILICHHLMKKTQNDVFDIIKTGQPPILYYIAHQFDKIISYQKSQYPALKQYRRPTIILPLILIILFFLIPNVMTLVVTYKNKIETPSKNTLMPILQPSEIAVNSYFLMVTVEMTRRNKSENSCVHDFFNGFNTTYSQGIQKVEMSFYNTSHHLVVISKVAFIVIIPLLLWYGVNLVNTAKHWKIRKYMLQFIPSHVSHSNPIFHELLKEGKVMNTTVKEFWSELKTPPSNFDFFCIIQYNSNESVVKITGNIKNFIEKVPSTLGDLRDELLLLFENENEQINEFFNAKILNSCLALSLPNGKDVTFSFASDPISLIIKDDHLNTENNMKQRISRHLDDYLSQRRMTATNIIEKCILILIDCFDQKILNEVSEKVVTFQSLKIIDSRYNKLVIMIQLTDQITSEISEFADQMENVLPNIRGCVVVGGPLLFFDGVKGALTKSRFVGEVYERAKKFLLEVKKGQFYFEKEVADLCGIERSEEMQKEFALVDGKVVQGVSYFE